MQSILGSTCFRTTWPQPIHVRLLSKDLNNLQDLGTILGCLTNLSQFDSPQSECVQNSQYLHRSFENLCHWIWTISMTSINVLDEICDHITSKEQFFTWKQDALCVSPAARHGVSSLAPARQSHVMRTLNNVESHEQQMVPKRCWIDCDTSLGGNMAASCAMTSERFRTYRVRMSMQRTEDTVRKL